MEHTTMRRTGILLRLGIHTLVGALHMDGPARASIALCLLAGWLVTVSTPLSLVIGGGPTSGSRHQDPSSSWRQAKARASQAVAA